jgi:hypothetical protein
LAVNPGVYLNAKVTQHVIEPALVREMGTGKDMIDLTSSLLRQGISHWKHTNRAVKFHPAPKFESFGKISAFPTHKNFEFVRIGGQMVYCDDPVQLDDDRVIMVTKLYCRDGDLKISGIEYLTNKSVVVSVSQFKQRFNPCFEADLLYPLAEEVTWTGDTIIGTERTVNFK